jgi:predicted nucleic acid-binding protein
LAGEDSDPKVFALILDTDILVWVLREHSPALRFVDSIPPGRRNLSAVTYMELLYGSHDARDLRSVKELVDDIFTEVIPVSEAISSTAIRLMEELVLACRIGVNDAFIAATALERHEPLATGNQKHFRMIPGLELKTFRP